MFVGFYIDFDLVLNIMFDEDYDELVLVKEIFMYFICEYYLVVFYGVVYVGYILGDDGRVIGLLKIV